LPDYIERYNPIGKSDYLSVQHLERYRYALTHLRPGQKVLDIGAGTGYGTAMLLSHGCDVVAADYDDKGIASARSAWNQGTFVTGNALYLPFQDSCFDSVLSFEIIEHVHDGDLFLSEMYRVLRPGGTYICSTPNIAYTVHPPYHVREYEPEEFYELVQKWFSRFDRYGQYFKATDRIRDLYRWHVYPRLKQLKLSKLARILYSRYVRWRLLRLMKELKAVKGSIFPKSIGSEGSPKTNWLSPVTGIRQALQDGLDNNYSVRSFTGSKLLRIMVVVARKENLA